MTSSKNPNDDQQQQQRENLENEKRYGIGPRSDRSHDSTDYRAYDDAIAAGASHDEALARQEWIGEARSMGVDAAKSAASWIVDGNTEQRAAYALLEQLRAGDPAAYDVIGSGPDLSGQWADSPTPRSLYADITGRDAHSDATFDQESYGVLADALADAWESGVSETYSAECERELIAFTAGAEITPDEALAFLVDGENAGLRVPCSRYGSTTEEYAPVAVALAEIIAENTGENLSRESVDYAMGLVVNDHDDVEALTSEHGSAEQRELIHVAPDEIDPAQVASNWHSGQSSALYSIASTGEIYSREIGESALREVESIRVEDGPDAAALVLLAEWLRENMPPSIASVADEALALAETRQREDGSSFVVFTTTDATAWLRDAIHAAHDDSMLPDDYVFATAREALEALTEADERDADDLRAEFTGNTDPYTSQLTAWLGSHIARQGFCDEAREEGFVSDDADISARISAGQEIERGRIFDAIAGALDAQVNA